MGTRHAKGGNTLLSREDVINVADIAERLNRRFTAINAIETAESFPIISLKSNYGLSDLRDETLATGSGAVSNVVGDGVYVLSTGATASSTASLASLKYGRYIAGTVAVTGVGLRVPTLPTGDQVGRWGYFDSQEGFGFGIDADGLFVFRRTGGVDTVIHRSDWDDPADGAGFSKADLDPENLNIYRIPFRWYGSGPAIFEVSDGEAALDLVPVHTFRASKELIIKDPNLPVTVEVENGSTASDFSLEVAGRQFSIVGRYVPNRRVTSEFKLAQTVGTTFVPLMTFLQKDEYKSVSVKLGGFDVLAASSSIVIELRVDAELTGADYVTPSNIPATETALEFDTSATAITGGQKLFTGLAQSGQGQSVSAASRDLPDLDMPVGRPVTLCARAVSGTATVSSSLRAREDW